MYTFVAPRGKLDEHWVTELRARIAENDSVAAVWWLTRIHDEEDPKVMVDEIHFELVDRPEAGTVETIRAISLFVPGGGPPFSITPKSMLEQVRNAGTRIF